MLRFRVVYNSGNYDGRLVVYLLRSWPSTSWWASYPQVHRSFQINTQPPTQPSPALKSYWIILMVSFNAIQLQAMVPYCCFNPEIYIQKSIKLWKWKSYEFQMQLMELTENIKFSLSISSDFSFHLFTILLCMPVIEFPVKFKSVF